MKFNQTKLSGRYVRQLKKIYLIMKLTWLLILALCLQSAASVWSQTTSMSLKMNQTSLQELFITIENKTGYRFFYNNDEVDVSQKVTVGVSDKPIGDILTQAFKDLPYSFREVGNKLILVERNTNPMGVIGSQQQKSISGKVTDSSGTPLPGVTVLLKNTTNGTITDANGYFSLVNLPSDATLIFSFVGMKTQTVEIEGKNSINIVMEEETKGIDEVVVIGYGTAKRNDYPGSISSLKIENSPISLLPKFNALESLKGNVAGLNIGTVNQAGQEPSMLIRGQNSINGSNNPLIVLDGVIYMGSIGDINPNDIANVDILKDAVSSAVYGSRSANGVIAITTKSGKSGKPVITFNTSAGIQTWQNEPVLLKGEEWFKVVFSNRKNGFSSFHLFKRTPCILMIMCKLLFIK